jgi:deazaflavin-dependent oxidoreductase (nitroreductase family)
MTSFDDQIIAEFRQNNGVVTANGFGDALILVHHRGAKSGAERVAPLMAIPEGDGWLVAASAAGAPKHPAWFHNLVAEPSTVVETVPVAASVLDGDDRDAAWAKFTSRSPGFAAYEERAGDRTIPVLLLTRR